MVTIGTQTTDMRDDALNTGLSVGLTSHLVYTSRVFTAMNVPMDILPEPDQLLRVDSSMNKALHTRLR